MTLLHNYVSTEMGKVQNSGRTKSLGYCYIWRLQSLINTLSWKIHADCDFGVKVEQCLLELFATQTSNSEDEFS